MKPVTAHVDAAFAALFATAALGLVAMSSLAAREAERVHGRNVDSGAIEFMVAVVYFGPVALGFALAALAGWQGWKPHKALHWLALCGALGPVAYSAWW